MPTALVTYITHYGYFAIFSLVFLQEIGVPNPVPNETVLLFAGYLSSAGILSFPLTFITVVSADFIGTSILYLVFYHFGELILEKKPKWIPLSKTHVQKISEKISDKGRWGIFVGRLVPYLRGYVSIAAGVLEIRPAIFLTTVIFSAILWSGGYAVAGVIIGPYWQTAADKIGGVQMIILTAIVVIALIFIIRHFMKKRRDTTGK